PSFVAEDEIVGAVVGGDAEATHAADGLAPEGHGGAERELHAFHGAGGEDAGGHFDRHADSFKPRPEAALSGHAAIKAAHAAYALAGKGQRHGAQVIRRHAHVAVGDDEDFVSGLELHLFHGGDFGVDVAGLAAGDEKFDGYVRVPRGDTVGGGETGIVGI